LFGEIFYETTKKQQTMKALFTGKSFFTGLLTGIFLISIYSFIPGKLPQAGETVTSVSLSTAKQYFRNYNNSAKPLKEVLKGISIDVNQLSAMNTLKSENPNLNSFRVYFAKTNTGENAGIVVGIDAQGNDYVTGGIYSTTAWNLNPCPVVCDVPGQITGE
jgi:hypothetical protein